MSANQNPIILRFDNVSFAYNEDKHPILVESSFAIRENTKITIMWQNWAGKSTIFKMIIWELKPQMWKINIVDGKTIAIARQVMLKEHLELSLTEFFATAFEEKDYQLDKKISDILRVVNFTAQTDKKIKDYSWWQQARLLLAYALIQHPDILLLDEPTNNLDKDWIWDLITFLFEYDKTVVVISHDADFLNLFTDWVLYLNKNRFQVEQYRWDYYSVVDQISAQIEKEIKNNARAEKKIADAKEKISQFAQKWWKMRKLAKKMRWEVEEAEENKVEVRKDDKTIPKFTIPFDNLVWPLISIEYVGLMNKNHQVEEYNLNLDIKKNQKYIFSGPNGIWKSTLLKKIVASEDENTKIHEWVRLWYYSQDFGTLDMNMNVWDSLEEVGDNIDQEIYKVASRFLLTWWLLKTTIWMLSEWQKWLLCYARFVLQRPHVLILDEPTNHINFRHLPIIADAVNKYEWWLIIVSHDKSFTDQLKWLEEIDFRHFLK